jgi:bacillithiol synthase
VLSGDVPVKAECLPFSQIPHTSRLFTDFLSYASSVRPFYPRSPQFSEWFREEAAKISYDPSRRERVTAILEQQNKSWGASSNTLENLGRLRKGAVAVVTGQQVGLFGGPMFAIYKALTAVKLAQEATAAGVEAVRVFWLATYDHDLAEVNHVSIPVADGGLKTLATTSHDVPGAPVGAVRFGEEIIPLVEAAMPLGFLDPAILRESYCPGETFGTAFARFYARLFADWGVILLDPSDAGIASMVEPVYRQAAQRAEELSASLLERGRALESAGYHQQVRVTDSSVLLFSMRDGARTAIHRRKNSSEHDPVFVLGDESSTETLLLQDLLARISANPEHFSPNVLLRPVVQDYLLPTLAYTGGAAEVAYFSQAAIVYEALLGRITPILPRFSATIVDTRMQRLLDRYGASFTDTFGGVDALRRQFATRSLPGDLQTALAATKDSLEANFSTVKVKLAALDPTLVDAAETARSKMQHQLEKLHAQAARAESQKSELISRHASTISDFLYPEKGLQERTVGAVYFLAHYGLDWLREVYECIHSDCHDHQILDL